jgi:dihydrofolate synthase/folylpolyglutamate synthase
VSEQSSSSSQSHSTDRERYASLLKQIWDRSAYDRGFISNPFAGDRDASIGLRRTEMLLEELGGPHDRFRILHVAGSKGKGSTCAFASSMLTAHGLRTGFYSSPHLHSFRERIVIDGIPITESAFADCCDRGIAAAERVEQRQPKLGQITAFELLTAMALDHFAGSGCDTAVVEVGLGGLLDATNVVDPVAALITTLDYEHTKVLGSTIAQIAANKAGIIKRGKPVATSALVPEARSVVADVVQREGSMWLMAGRDWSWTGSWQTFALTGPWGALDALRSGLVGAHQVDNAALALAGIWLMLGERMQTESVARGLAETTWPGRFEIVNRGTRTVILDGAHTPAAAAALALAVAEAYPNRRCEVLLGVLADKDPAAIAGALVPIADRFVAVTPPGPRGLPAQELARTVSRAGVSVMPAESVAGALDSLESDLALVTGSLSTVAAAREAMDLAIPDPIFSS